MNEMGIIMNSQDIIKQIYLKNNEINKLQNEVNSLKSQINYTNDLSNDEKAKIFMNYFKGRTDIYPSFYLNENNEKRYQPKCKNIWDRKICYKTQGKSCNECPYFKKEELSISVIKNHLFSNKPIGIYMLLEDNTTYFLAFDFDDKEGNKDIKNDILNFLDICDTYNIPISIERSQSGKGYHLWLFFENKIKAVIVRKLAYLLLSKAKEKCNLSSFDRMFPTQDYLSKKEYGNLIALPFQKEAITNGNTLFVDRNFNCYQDQYKYLSHQPKMKEIEIINIINLLSVNNESKEITSINPYPQNIDVILDDMIYINKKTISSSLIKEIKKLASFSNSNYFKAKKLSKSTYNIPIMIDCSIEENDYIKLPRGTYEKLINYCNLHNIKLNIIDKRNKGNKINIKFKGNLYDNQNESLNELIKYDIGILEAPTAFGKTVTACKLIELKSINTLIITFSVNLLNQWKNRLMEFLDIKEVGTFCGRKKNLTNIIDIATIQSIYNKGNIKDIVKNYGMVIIDECQHTSASTYEQTLNKVNARYVYGLSATPYKEDGKTKIIKMQCGEIRNKINLRKFNQSLNLTMKVLIKNINLNNPNPNIIDYSLNEIYNIICKDNIRNNTILNDIKIEYEKGKNILVLTERIEHLEYLQNSLLNITKNLIVYRGNMNSKEIKKYEEIIKTINNTKENKIVLATSKCIGEGYDDSSLEILFLTMPISANHRVLQYAGRLHRRNDIKSEIKIYDYVDENFLITRNMLRKRKKSYKKMGYEIMENNLEQLTII